MIWVPEDFELALRQSSGGGGGGGWVRSEAVEVLVSD